MRAGELSTQISIEKKSVTTDSTYGTEVIAWVPLVPVGSPAVAQRFWASVIEELPSRSESVRQGLAVARNQVKITTRYRSDVDSSMRITVHRDGDRVFQIVGGPAMIGRKKFMEFVCERFSS
jgi:SPP1 family predicted phage head-tail adaptor